MKSLKRTTVFGDHYHLVFLNDERGYGITSADKENGHVHQVEWVPPTEEVPPSQDPVTGEVLPGQPAQPGYWAYSPGPDGHVHDHGEDIPLVKKSIASEDKNEWDTVAEVLECFNTWYEYDKPSIEAGQASEDFRSGKQWNDSDRQTLNAQGRACLTINRIANKIDTLSGFERKQRTDIRFVPQESGDQKAADLYNILVKQLLDKCNFWRERSESFEDLIVAGKGSWNIRISRDNDLRGDVIVERFPWDQSVYAPFDKADASDSEGFCKYRWFSLSKAQQLWPDKADELKSTYTTVVDRLPYGIERTRPGNQQDTLLGANSVDTNIFGQYIDLKRKSVLVIECARHVHVKVPVIGNIEEDFYVNAWQYNKADLEKASTIPGFVRFDRTIKKIRITKVAGGKVLLSDENPADLPSDDFYFVPFYAYRKRGQYWGKVEQVKDSQLLINKLASQATDIGNRMVSYNYFYDRDTFPDNELKRFIETSAEPGAMFEVNSLSKLPVKTEGAKFPSEIVNLMALQERLLDEGMNVVPEPGGANESGAAILQKQQIKMTGNEFLFDSLGDAMIRLGRLLVPIIKKYYPAERVVRIVRSAQSTTMTPNIGGVPLDEFTDDDILQLLEQSDLEKFDLVVGESAYSPTSRLGTFLILTDLAAKGVDIPAEMILQYADMPEKDKEALLARLEEQQQAANQATATAGDAEIEKTLVAKNIIPPSVAERFGIPPTVGQPTPDGEQPQPSPDPALMTQ
jgi:hypothetical protein